MPTACGPACQQRQRPVHTPVAQQTVRGILRASKRAKRWYALRRVTWGRVHFEPLSRRATYTELRPFLLAAIASLPHYVFAIHSSTAAIPAECSMGAATIELCDGSAIVNCACREFQQLGGHRVCRMRKSWAALDRTLAPCTAALFSRSWNDRRVWRY
jgi:hypothetical protein